MKRQQLISRRRALQTVATFAAGLSMKDQLIGTAFAQSGRRSIPVTSLNHMTLAVSDPAASLAWYQGLFGLPIAARQNNTIVLQVGDGPH